MLVHNVRHGSDGVGDRGKQDAGWLAMQIPWSEERRHHHDFLCLVCFLYVLYRRCVRYLSLARTAATIEIRY